MRKRLFFATVCIFLLPILFAPSRRSELTHKASFATAVFAGHKLDGSYCDCGSDGCLLDCGLSRMPEPRHHPSRHETGGLSEAGVGIGAILLVLGLMVTRMIL